MVSAGLLVLVDAEIAKQLASLLPLRMTGVRVHGVIGGQDKQLRRSRRHKSSDSAGTEDIKGDSEAQLVVRCDEGLTT